MFDLNLLIRNEFGETEAIVEISEFETLAEAAAGMNNVVSVLTTVFSLSPGESYTIYAPDPENKNGDPPNLVGADEENWPIF